MTYYRRLPKFEYIPAQTIKESLALLEDRKNEAKVVAGGTDLLLQMKSRLLTPKYLISLKQIGELDYINHNKTDGLRLGPLTTIASVDSSTVIQNNFNILAQATCNMASPQIRNVATIAGNLCTAVPSADTAPALIVLGANLKLMAINSERTMAIEDFFTGPRQTVLKTDELLTEIQVPDASPSSKGVYLKQGLRKAMSLATVGVAVLITLEDNFCQDIRIALGAVAPIPLRARRAESVLRGKPLNDSLVTEAARSAAEEAIPISDIRASEEYRRDLVYVLTRRAIQQASEKGNTTLA